MRFFYAKKYFFENRAKSKSDKKWGCETKKRLQVNAIANRILMLHVRF